MRQSPVTNDLQETLELAIQQLADKEEVIAAMQQVAALYANTATTSIELSQAQLFLNNVADAALQTARDHQIQAMALKLEQLVANDLLRNLQAAVEKVDAEAQQSHKSSRSISPFWQQQNTAGTETVEQSDRQAPSITA